MENHLITSTQNPTVKMVVELHTTQGRKRHELFIVEGLRTCESFINNGYQPTLFFVTQDQESHAQTLFSQHELTIVTEAVMHKMSTATTPSGFLALFSLPQPITKALTAGLVLANITDPGNMGTLIRSCAAFGYNSVVVVEGCDPFSPKVIQASAGTLPLVSLFQLTWKELLERKQKESLQLAALVAHKGRLVTDIAEKNILFVVGNEAHGISEALLADCDMMVTIPMHSAVESLNAGVAGSIALALHSAL